MSKIDLQASIYVPQVQNIPPEFLTPQFLLGI